MLGRKKAAPETPQPQPPRAVPAPASLPPRPQPQARAEAPARGQMHIGKSVRIKGELTASEEMTIDGMVDGRIVVENHLLTIGSHGRITAEVHAKTLVVHGNIVGNVSADEKVEVRLGGMVEGDIRAPRVILADGSVFKGNIDMAAQTTREAAPVTEKQRAAPAPADVEVDVSPAPNQPSVDDFAAPFDVCSDGEAVAGPSEGARLSDRSKQSSLL